MKIGDLVRPLDPLPQFENIVGVVFSSQPDCECHVADCATAKILWSDGDIEDVDSYDLRSLEVVS